MATMRMSLCLVMTRIMSLCLAALGTNAQMLTPTNWTSEQAADTNDDTVMMQISIGQRMVPLAPVLALTQRAGSDIPPTGLSGPVLLTTTSNVLDMDVNDVSFISCDVYPGNIQVGQVFEQAIQTVPAAVVLYSSFSDYCNLTDYAGNDYPWIYTLKNRSDTENMLSETAQSGQETVYAAIGTNAARDVNGTGPASGSSGNGGGNENQNVPPGGAPSTAVAMVILYSITGIITALFLVIIITGAVRARRHPERYGPRNIVGRPRQSRARGLAIAMLETLPVVKFNEHRDETKPTDLELGEHSPERTSEHPPTSTEDAQPQTSSETTDPGRSVEEGIGAAATGVHQPPGQPTNPDHLGCSICTEDFQSGEDQRVLPCDHRFHPACIDPWLLNVSGTCPLCRIDLRPQPEDTGEVDEAGNPILREPGETLESSTVPEAPPPLQRLGVRRSILEGIRGIGRPTQMSREERIVALQQMRAQNLDRMRRQSEVEAAEEERGTRQRLRRVFGVRTRETPTRGPVDAEASGAADGGESEAAAGLGGQR